MRRTLIAGNWKMNGSQAANAALLADVRAGLANANCDIAVCVPAPYFAQCQAILNFGPVAWGAQDVSMHESGAYTGETSASMLADFGCTYALVGHSERRSYHAESDETVAQKAVRALGKGIMPVVCVGETLAEREAGQTAAVVRRQLAAVLQVIEAGRLVDIVVAYEPVWAIGTGKTATPAMAQEVHQLLRAQLAEHDETAAKKVRILYGGSMKPENAKELMAQPDIDGGLIGGAALKAQDFLAVIAAAK